MNEVFENRPRPVRELLDWLDWASAVVLVGIAAGLAILFDWARREDR